MGLADLQVSLLNQAPDQRLGGGFLPVQLFLQPVDHAARIGCSFGPRNAHDFPLRIVDFCLRASSYFIIPDITS